jgi:prepilin-type N-terminal cleavage/methylation domain-containing protein
MKKLINAIRKFAMEKRKAFTLIELMGVLVIIGILTVILVPVINNTIKNNKQELYDNQLEMIRLAAQNLATDNTYILPEEDGEEIYITLGQLRAMGYAEGTIIDPLTNKNFPDNLIVMIIKKGNDYDYVINLDGDVTIVDSDIQVAKPSRKYINKGTNSFYIITVKPDSETEEEKSKNTLGYYINIGKENINLLGAVDEKVKYKLDGNNGLYKLTVLGGDKNGYLYFSLNNLKDYEGKEIDVSTTNNDINSNKKIIVDNEPLKCNWSGENTTWTNEEVSIVLTGSKDKSDGLPKAPMKGLNKIQTYNENGTELQNDNLSFDIEDEAGNVTACSKTVNVYYDKKPPTIPTITGQRLYNESNVGTYTSNTWTNNDVRMNYSSTDSGVGEVYYQYSHNGSNWISNSSNNGFASTNTSWKISWDSVYDYYIRACDGLNNCSSSSLMTIKIDKTAPTCNWEPNWTWTSSNVTVKVYGTDSGSGMSDQNSKSWTYSGANEEINTAWLAYTIKDNAGNEKDCSGDVSVKHDTLAPRANCWWAGPREGSGNQFSLQCSVSDSSTVYTALGYCYQYNDSTQYWTCSYKNLEDRYNGYGWRAISDYYFGFNISLKNDVNTMDLKIGFKDEAGNLTGPWYLQKKA